MAITVGGVIKAVNTVSTVVQTAKELKADFDRAVCEDKIRELEGLIGRLESHQTNLVNLKNRIPAFWEDERATKVVAALNRTMADVNKKMNTAKELVATYKNAMQAMEKSESAVSEFLEDALALLGALE